MLLLGVTGVLGLAASSDDYYARTRGANSPAPRILEAIHQGAQTSHQIGALTSLPVKRISVTVRHMREQGQIAIAGRTRGYGRGNTWRTVWKVA